MCFKWSYANAVIRWHSFDKLLLLVIEATPCGQRAAGLSELPWSDTRYSYGTFFAQDLWNNPCVLSRCNSLVANGNKICVRLPDRTECSEKKGPHTHAHTALPPTAVITLPGSGWMPFCIMQKDLKSFFVVNEVDRDDSSIFFWNIAKTD
jgi:hypothetical protein